MFATPSVTDTTLPTFLTQQPSGPSQQQPDTDPNSPLVFKQNVHLVLEQVAQVQEMARRALAGIEHAYHPASTPTQTDADISTLKQTLLVLTERLRQSGIGALPLNATNANGNESLSQLSEEQLLADTTRGVQVLFERLKRNQESASVVVDLLASGVSGR